MANQHKDRVPDETVAASSPPGVQPARSHTSVLFVRLWLDEGKRMDARPSKTSAPLLNLVEDTARACGGASEAENTDHVVARFPDLLSGLQCARRIQWAVEGLAESFRGAAAAMLVDACDESGRYAAPTNQDWDGAVPGTIVLKRGVLEGLEGLPGLALGKATAGGCREWVWRSNVANANFAADEQVVLGMLRAAGRSDPVTGVSAPAGADASTDAATRLFTRAGTAAAGQDAAGQDAAGRGGDAAVAVAGKSRMPLIAGAAAVVLIAVAVIFFLTRKSSLQSAAPPVQDGKPAQSMTPAAQAPVGETSAAPSTNSTTAKRKGILDSVKNALNGGAKAAPPATSHCDLTGEDIERSLDRADRYMHAGDLADARAAYQHVLGCPSAHEKAQEGLVRIQRMAAQSGSPNR